MAKGTKTKSQIQKEKHQAFVRLAEARMEKLLKDFSLLGNLTSKNYHYTQAEADKIIRTLRNRLDDLERQFNKNEDTKFRL